MIIQTDTPQYHDVEPQLLNKFFLRHLDRIYCAKSHLVERLQESNISTRFKDLHRAVNKTCKDVNSQIARINRIYVLLGSKASMQYCDGLVAMVEDAFLSIHQQQDSEFLRNLSILAYLHEIESVEIASFNILLLAASHLPDKQVAQLIKENLDEANEDCELVMLITKKYLNP